MRIVRVIDRLDIDKCQFSVKETKYLGLIITTKGIKMDPEKVKAITTWEEPGSVKEVQQFMGFANFYRRFIKGFSKIAAPLTSLQNRKSPFLFSEECRTAFNNLKAAFSAAPILAFFDPKRKTVVETDASVSASA